MVVRSTSPDQPLELLDGEPEADCHATHVAQGRQAQADQVGQRLFAFTFPWVDDPGLRFADVGTFVTLANRRRGNLGCRDGRLLETAPFTR